MTESARSYWEKKADEVSRSSLDTIRSSASSWAATTSTLLGVFGTAVFIKGPDSFAKVAPSDRDAVLGLVCAGLFLSFVSIIITASAARPIPKKFSPLTGISLALWVKAESAKARRLLLAGKVTAVVAAGCVASAGLIPLAGSSVQSTEQQAVLVRTSEGAMQCGVLQRAKGSLALSDGHKVVLRLDKNVVQAAAVASCPETEQTVGAKTR